MKSFAQQLIVVGACACCLSDAGRLVVHALPFNTQTETADPYSSRTLLRLWELAGGSGKLTITLPAGLSATRALPVNLRGEPADKAIQIKNHAFKTSLPAFAPASFVFDTQEETKTMNN